MTQDENTRLDSPQDEATSLDLNQPTERKSGAIAKSPKNKKQKGPNKSILIAILVLIIGGATACAYFFVPWKSLFGKESIGTVYDDDEDDAEKAITGINPFNGQPVTYRRFTISQLNKMQHVEWNPRDLSREEVESLVLIPEKKLLIGYNLTCGDNVIYDNALGPRGGLLWGDDEVMPSEDQQFEMLSDYSEEEIVDSLMSTQIAIVDDAPKKEMKTAQERYEDERQVGVVNVDAPIATATKEVVEIAPAKEAKQEDEVFRAVEQMPIYPGGDAALYKAINDNLVYPSLAAENNIQGQVVVQFVIQKDGSIGKVVVARSVDPDLDREAIRVVKKLGKFTPGRNNGTPVAVWYTLPIRFKLASM